MPPLPSPTLEEVESVLAQYGQLSPEQLIEQLYPQAEEIFLRGGLSGENPWDAVDRWCRETLVPACQAAGARGARVLKILADPKLSTDLATVKLVSDFLIDYTDVAFAPGAKLAVGIAVLVIYCARQRVGVFTPPT